MSQAPSITVRSLHLSAMHPAVCAPISGATQQQILAHAQTVCASAADMAEWRADSFTSLLAPAEILSVAQALRTTLAPRPLLFTIRTKPEGGDADLTHDQYLNINLAAITSGHIDLVDVELSKGEPCMRAAVDAAHAAGVFVVGSSHDFAATPPRPEIVRRLRAMRALGADIPKIAVMPQSFDDVLTLLGAAAEFRAEADCPFVAISMGNLGALSRIACAWTGSCFSFGTAGAASAPGQLNAQNLRRILDLVGA